MDMFKSIFKINILLIFIFLSLTTSLRSEIIDEINVEGNQRISKETIIMFADVSIKDEVSDKDLNEILKRNFYNSKEIISFLKNIGNDEKIIALFSSKWMLKT